MGNFFFPPFFGHFLCGAFRSGPFGPRVVIGKRDPVSGEICRALSTSSPLALFEHSPANTVYLRFTTELELESWDRRRRRLMFALLGNGRFGLMSEHPLADVLAGVLARSFTSRSQTAVGKEGGRGWGRGSRSMFPVTKPAAERVFLARIGIRLLLHLFPRSKRKKC